MAQETSIPQDKSFVWKISIYEAQYDNKDGRINVFASFYDETNDKHYPEHWYWLSVIDEKIRKDAAEKRIDLWTAVLRFNEVIQEHGGAPSE